MSRGCASGGDISKEEAVAIAREQALFAPDAVQVRFFRRGVSSRGAWAVSLYRGDARSPTRVQVVVVDAQSGDVVDDGR